MIFHISCEMSHHLKKHVFKPFFIPFIFTFFYTTQKGTKCETCSHLIPFVLNLSKFNDTNVPLHNSKTVFVHNQAAYFFDKIMRS